MELVSIIIPTFKGYSNLSRAIESCLDQSYKDIEIIIVDDNIKKISQIDYLKTKKVVEKYINITKGMSIRYIVHDDNKGGSAARNTGIKNANGKYICFLDDDDFYLKDRVKKSVMYLQNNLGDSGVICQVLSTLDNSRRLNKLTSLTDSYNLNEKLLLNTMYIGTGSNLFFRKESVDSIGYFDETFVRFQDIEYMIKFSEKLTVGMIDEYLIVKSTNETNNLPNFFILQKSWEVLKINSEETLNQIKKNGNFDLFIKSQSEIFIYPLALLPWNEIIKNYTFYKVSIIKLFVIKLKLYLSKYKIYKKVKWLYKSKLNIKIDLK
ncbi:glycosyltransferase family 2 protein [Enterococcus devriesei]|uniref:glycosyltransferase family 2 protein n=1 Tax=Enterococcus devriesei TaxID=319970 RepID=UPI002890D684|nr:glycosyltransferase family 2 protein [Enterococcus devriesei]MDT2822154.1 glycosyltransferase family 2 protein [Enterococcus devriesei]